MIKGDYFPVQSAAMYAVADFVANRLIRRADALYNDDNLAQ